MLPIWDECLNTVPNKQCKGKPKVRFQPQRKKLPLLDFELPVRTIMKRMYVIKICLYYDWDCKEDYRWK